MSLNKLHPPVYTHSADIALQNGELDLYRESEQINRDCAQAIDEAVQASNYKLYHYDLKTAAKNVISEYGAERTQYILASVLLQGEWDGRFSDNNKEWAKEFSAPKVYSGFTVNTHPAVLNGFIQTVRDAVMESQIQPAQPDNEPGEYKYYSLCRPVDIGAIPKGPKPEKVSNFDWKMPVEDGAFSAWGSVTYKQPLTDKQVEEFELRAAASIPREKSSVLKNLRENKEAVPPPKKSASNKQMPEL